MGKFIIIQDMRHLRSYKNVNARLLYIHMAMGCDISTYEYKSSLRKLSLELGMTVDTVRYALKLLASDGLITPQSTPQITPQSTPQTTPQTTPHLTTFIINKNGTPNGTPNTTLYTTLYTTENPTEKNNLNNLKNNNPPLTSARVAWADMREVIKKALDVDAATAAAMVDTFKERQAMKGKIWKDEGDLKAHLVAFAEKRLASLPLPRQTARESDQQARAAEMRRVKEQQENQNQKERDWDQVQTAWRWWKQAEREAERTENQDERVKLRQLGATHQEAYEKLRSEWINKYQPQKTE